MLPDTKPFAPQTRRARNRAEMRAAILETARAVMRQDGVAALNLHKVAAGIGIKTPSLYEYFDGKMGVYDALFRLGFEQFAESMTRALETATNWHAALRAGMETYMQFALDSPELYQLCFERPVPGFVPSEESLGVSFTLLRQSTARVERFLRESNLKTGLTPAQINDLSIAMMHGLTAQHMANEPHLPLGKGRYGSLIPAAVALFQAAWEGTPRDPAPASAHKTRTPKKERET
jgi:AcrR family transcriptional regulator